MVIYKSMTEVTLRYSEIIKVTRRFGRRGGGVVWDLCHLTRMDKSGCLNMLQSWFVVRLKQTHGLFLVVIQLGWSCLHNFVAVWLNLILSLFYAYVVNSLPDQYFVFLECLLRYPPPLNLELQSMLSVQSVHVKSLSDLVSSTFSYGKIQVVLVQFGQL